jgi:ATP-dependent helicase HrpA
LPRYLKAVVLRLDKLKADPARDAARLAELRPLEQRHLRKLAERRGSRDSRLDEFRWWLEELRVSLFAQELKTPQPVSAKRTGENLGAGVRLNRAANRRHKPW